MPSIGSQAVHRTNIQSAECFPRPSQLNLALSSSLQLSASCASRHRGQPTCPCPGSSHAECLPPKKRRHREMSELSFGNHSGRKSFGLACSCKTEEPLTFVHLGVDFFWRLLKYLQPKDVVHLGSTCHILSYIFLKNPVWLFFAQGASSNHCHGSPACHDLNAIWKYCQFLYSNPSKSTMPLLADPFKNEYATQKNGSRLDQDIRSDIYQYLSHSLIAADQSGLGCYYASEQEAGLQNCDEHFQTATSTPSMSRLEVPCTHLSGSASGAGRQYTINSNPPSLPLGYMLPNPVDFHGVYSADYHQRWFKGFGCPPFPHDRSGLSYADSPVEHLKIEPCEGSSANGLGSTPVSGGSFLPKDASDFYPAVSTGYSSQCSCCYPTSNVPPFNRSQSHDSMTNLATPPSSMAPSSVTVPCICSTSNTLQANCHERPDVSPKQHKRVSKYSLLQMRNTPISSPDEIFPSPLSEDKTAKKEESLQSSGQQCSSREKMNHRGRSRNDPLLWEFLAVAVAEDDLARLRPDLGPSVFQIIKPGKLAKKWGQVKGNSHMTYGHMSRAIRKYKEKGDTSKVLKYRGPCSESYLYTFGETPLEWCRLKKCGPYDPLNMKKTNTESKKKKPLPCIDTLRKDSN